MDKKKWIITIIIGVIISLLGYAGARDRELTKTVVRVDNIEKDNDKASNERNEMIKKLDEQNNQLSSMQTILKLMAEKQGIRYD